MHGSDHSVPQNNTNPNGILKHSSAGKTKRTNDNIENESNVYDNLYSSPNEHINNINKEDVNMSPNTDIDTNNKRRHRHGNVRGRNTDKNSATQSDDTSADQNNVQDADQHDRHNLNEEPYVYLDEDESTVDDESSTSSSQRGAGSRGRQRYRLPPSESGTDRLQLKYLELQRLTDTTFQTRQTELIQQHAHHTKLLYRQYKNLAVDGVNKGTTVTQRQLPAPRDTQSASNVKNQNGHASADSTHQQPNTTSSNRPKSALIRMPQNQRLTASLTLQRRSISADKNRRSRSHSADSLSRAAGYPTDHLLKETKNDKIINWLKQKNVLHRKKLRDERTRKRTEYQERILEANEKLERRLESQKMVKDWMERKRKDKLREERETQSRMIVLPNNHYESKLLVVLQASSQGTELCDSDGYGRRNHTRFPQAPTPRSSRSVPQIMEGYRRKKHNQSMSNTGVTASGKALSSRPSSARGNHERMSYDKWLVEKRRDVIASNHQRKQAAINKILTSSDDGITTQNIEEKNTRNSDNRIMHNGGTNFVNKSDSTDIIDELSSSLTRDDMIEAASPSLKPKRKLSAKKRRSKTQPKEVVTVQHHLPFPPNEGVPVHVARVQRKIFSRDLIDTQTQRPEPQGSDGAQLIARNGDVLKNGDSQTKHNGDIIDSPDMNIVKLNGSNKRANSVTYKANLADNHVKHSVSDAHDEPLGMPTADIVEDNMTDTDSERGYQNRSVVESYDLLRQNKIAQELNETIFVSDETPTDSIHNESQEYAENDNETNDDVGLTRRRSVDKHVAFSEDDPEVIEYDPIEFKNDHDEVNAIEHINDEPGGIYVDEVLEVITSDYQTGDELEVWESRPDLDIENEKIAPDDEIINNNINDNYNDNYVDPHTKEHVVIIEQRALNNEPIISNGSVECGIVGISCANVGDNAIKLTVEGRGVAKDESEI